MSATGRGTRLPLRGQAARAVFGAAGGGSRSRRATSAAGPATPTPAAAAAASLASPLGGRKGAPAAGGFTLLEMLVVVGIAGLIAGIGFPRLQAQVAAQEWRTGVAAIGAMLRGARADAVRTGAVTAVAIAGDGRAARRDGGAAVALPASVAAAADRPILFYGDGSASGGAVTVSGPRRRAVLAVAPVTGLVTVAAS